MSQDLLALDDEALAELSDSFETSPPGAVVRWAVRTFGRRLCLASSMEDAVLIDIATRVDPGIEVVFIDTGYHFPETLDTLEVVRRRYSPNLTVLRVPPSSVPLWRADPESCCARAKVEQMDIALVGKDAWMTGIRRTDSATRATSPIVGRDSRGLIKANPLATWTDDDVATYIADHDVPVNPLLAKGYLSIGCAPCTIPVEPGADPRSGRWPGLNKTECGLHE